jgi:hypothetical protein
MVERRVGARESAPLVVFRLLAFQLLFSVTTMAQPSRPASPVASEASRQGAEYFVQRAGTAWVYALPRGKGRVAISSVVEWRAHVSISLGKLSGSATWRVKDGAWLERSGLRGEGEAVVLPATMTRGTRWSGLASLERGGGKVSVFEVLALDAQVELPSGLSVEHCLAVLETAPEGGDAYTHYYAPNMGKVAVQGPDGWLLRLVEFHPARRGHSE